eukprot:TRINITY_DN24061_c0_g2_i1.p1 TRINITY_DN24061_c0_g2~~TRINITY_DN24061_c0_g2_i1.p1  ORF type:complete len:364 (-),score=96.18 TRINITY_DN24061_c0_g2_i1:105-1148(-)
MKLKRFLLRYDPPGIGLEVEEDGQTDVRHQECPDAASVSGTEEISRLADELLLKEPDLLSKRRHRNAIVQMLGRLYQIDVSTMAQEEEEKTEKSPAAPISPSAQEDDDSVNFVEGMSVVLVGLKGKLQVHNGEVGTLLKVKAEKQKYEVELQPSKTNPEAEVVKVKGSEFVVPMAPRTAALSVGDHVAIRGLRNHTELNGCLGRVVEAHKEMHRYEVRATETGQLFRVKQENLVPVARCPQILRPAAFSAKENRDANSPKKDSPGGQQELAGEAGKQAPVQSGDMFEPGSLVELAGLKTAMIYNGQQAEVLFVDAARGRYEIRLHDGSVKTIRAENVRLISPPSKRK